MRCFYCDGGLRCWEPADEAWVEHAKWFPQCLYLLEVKGADYVETVHKTADHASEPRGKRQLGFPLAKYFSDLSEFSLSFFELIKVYRRTNFTPGSPCGPDEETVIRRVLEMGFLQPSVEQALRERRLADPIEVFRNVEELINAVLVVENRKKR